jgi:hypothetical protein
LFVIFVSANTLDAKENAWTPVRLRDGHIDLQGVWAHTNLTPFERPSDLKTLVISTDDATAIKQRIDAKNDDLTRPAEPSIYFDDRSVEPIRGELRSSIIVDPIDGAIPGNALFKETMSRARSSVLTAFDGPEQRPASERCLGAPSATPPTQLIPASDLRQIVQTPNAVVMAFEELHEARIIRMKAQHAPATITSWLGDSIGWWEGDTLVVETKYFSPASALRMSPNSSFVVSPATTVTERFTRISADEMWYEFAVEDPTYYTQVWRGESRFSRSSALLLEYACHEGNYALNYVLESARALESESD